MDNLQLSGSGPECLYKPILLVMIRFFRPLPSVVLLATAMFQSSLLAEPSAAEIAAKLKSITQDGSSYVRLKMEINNGGSLQIQARQRQTPTGTDLVYQILFPKERKGESVLLRKPAGAPATGAVFTPPDSLKPLAAGEMKSGLFGSDLHYEDMVENFFAWGSQSLVGTETVGRVNCHILESKPSGGGQSSYASVRTWVDSQKMVPMRVEKYNASGAVLVRIETLSVAKDDLGRDVPSSLHIARAGSRGGTTMDGSRIKHGVSLTDADFTPESLRNLSAPK